MSMRDYPTGGYIVPLDSLKSLLNAESQEALNKCLEEYDAEAITDCLTANLPEGLPPIAGVYCPAEDDTVDEPMEHSVWYAIFEENELYVKRPTPEHETLVKLGIKPEYACWSQWG